MPRYLALELSRTESRLLLARAGSGGVAVEEAFCTPWNSDETSSSDAAVQDAALIAALADRGLARLPVIGIVGRSDVELRLLQLPPAPDEELPDMVRFQAGQDFPNFEPDAALDFLPLEGAVDAPRRVLAAALKSPVAQRFMRICEAANLQLERLILHPAAAASLLLRRRPGLQTGWCLALDVLDGQAELTAIRDGRVVLSRQVLLPDGLPDNGDAAERFAAEIRRTRAAAANQEGLPLPQAVFVFGQGAPWTTFAKRLGDSLDLTVEPVDPFPANTAVAEFDVDRQPRFAAMVGALADAGENRPPAFDFLHPRKRPEPPSRRNTYVLAGLAVAMLILAAMLINFLQARSLKADILRIQKEAKALEKRASEADKIVANAEEVGTWVNNEVVWLDELRWLSDNFTSSQDAMLTTLVATEGAGQPEIRLDGIARDVDAASRLDRQLQDKGHRLLGKTKSEDHSDARYRIQFRSIVQIEQPQ